MMPRRRRRHSTARLLTAAAAAALLVAAGPCAAAPSVAEERVRAGDAAGALAALDAGGEAALLPPAVASYWRGRAQAMLGRLEAAEASFARVPEGHPLYPYAARGRLYCAWCSPRLELPAVARPLAASADAAVASLALAALAEHELRYTSEGGDTQDFYRLKEKAQQELHLLPVALLLELHLYRHQGDYDGGIDYARRLEQDAALSPLMKQRVRLALAELYYAKEAAAPAATEEEGKGEETLLQFITANAESPLLEEAFRRLYLHAGATGSDYARAKLRDWAEDTMHPKRAALALYTLLRMELPHGAEPATLANRAATELPGEPLTRAILQELIRKLLTRGKVEEAALYIHQLSNLQQEPDARTLFLSGMSHRAEPREAQQLFRRSAETADGELLTPALVNTLLCAMACGDTASAEQLLRAPVEPRTRCALLLAHAGLLLQSDPARARQELQEAAALCPTPEQCTDMRLDEAALLLAEAPGEALAALSGMGAEERKGWTQAQALRHAALLEAAADATHRPAQELLYTLYQESDALPIKQELAQRVATLMMRHNRYREALELLQELADLLPAGAQKAQALYYAGYAASRLGSLSALEEAVRLYAESARQGSPLAPRALIEQAATLVRINRTAQALELLRPLAERQAQLSPAVQAHLLTALADAHGMEMTPQGLAAAIDCCDKIAAIADLPAVWRTRALLQRAALYTRLSRREEAVADYRRAMRAERWRARPEAPQSCLLLYYAAAGAVYQLMQLERFAEAANLADATAAWPGTPARPAEQEGPKADSFRRWAQSIRQTHFLPVPVLEEGAEELF